ncbi:metallophosphoesterase [Candidatus Venteria ishoeyi]|uniref:metallophosphoesterase family protein n=1 Tax=Candidatus Venteria ishoeyi TaxID=1899563 RepID=UPI0025A5EE2B|nr:metallophosphoesterase [Candidatus Venteria ishoeyi]MDM8546976.1 metallophosphoesterase [Candidatus Venteria ishoeyi]
MTKLSRRFFLQTIGAAVASTVVGCTSKPILPVQGSAKRHIRLAFYTDIHARKEWDTPEALAMAAASINAQHPDIVLGGGDYITDGFQSSVATVAHRWDAYMKMHNNIQATLFPAIGNHDLVAALPEDGTPAAEDPRAIYLQKMGLARTYYAFDTLGYHFIVLDSVEVTGGKYKYRGFISPAQMEWLKQDLAALKSDTPIVVITHVPLVTAFYNVTQGVEFKPRSNRVIVNNKEVLELFSQHNLILVLQGHLHVKERYQWGNTTFITGGAVCGKWWRRGNWYKTKPGYNLITLNNNHVEWEYVEYGWQPRRP